jgi:riboflavin kinase/FMN adenylyltransferase
MNIFNNITEIKRDEATVLTIGTFDGVHLGHQEIIKKVIDISKKESLRNLVVTFYPHPRKVIYPDTSIQLLTTQVEQEEIFYHLKVDNLLRIRFTDSFSKITPLEFVKEYIVEKIGVRKIVIGYDHHFGKAREGNVNFLKSVSKEFGFDVIEINPLVVESTIVSSSLIRKELTNGNILFANKMLGRNYSFSGVVISGDGRGRNLGYPTANIKLDDDDKLLPKLGIYAVHVFIEQVKHNGLLSIGKRPTFYNNGNIVPEVYIYDFNDNIYGKRVRVDIIEKIREEEKFNSAEELVNQMNIDKQNGLKIFNKFKQLNN